MKTSQSSTDSQSGKTSFGDGSINDTLGAEAVEEASSHFVSIYENQLLLIALATSSMTKDS